jgi:hypothetical protein
MRVLFVWVFLRAFLSGLLFILFGTNGGIKMDAA